MFGPRSRTLCLSFLVLCSFPSLSYSQSPEPLPDGWYAVSEEELTRLEEIMTAQETILKRQAKQLDVALTQLKEADQTTNNLSLSIGRLKASLSVLERENRVRTAINWVLAGSTAVLTVLYLLK